MKILRSALAAISAAFFFASAVSAQNSGTVTNHAFVLGKGAGQTGFTSLLCGSAQLAVGQSAADPICRSITGDVSLSAAGAITLATVNSNVGSFGSATQCVAFTVNAKGLITAASAATCTPAVGSITGLGTGVATALGVNIGSAGAFITFNGALGTPSSGTLTNATGLPISTGVSGLGAGCATFLATPSSANLRGCLTDEVGTGAFYTVGGALGTPASATLTNATGLPLSGLTSQAAWSFVVNNTSGSASPTAVDIASFTTKASPAAGDYVVLSDQAASGALKKATVSSIASAGSVSSIAGNTGAFTLSQGITNSTNDIRLDVSYMRGHWSGCQLSAAGSSTTLTVTSCVTASDDFTTLMKVTSTYTKSMSSTWTVGSTGGCLDTGSTGATTWYHVFQIMRTDTGVVDYLCSLSATAPTLPTNYTKQRRIGSFKTDGSSNIIAYAQNFDTFTWAVPVTDLNQANPTSGSRQTVTLASVPTGVVVEPNLQWGGDNTTNNFNALVTSLAMADTAPSATLNSFRVAGTGVNPWAGSNIRVVTNTSAQVGYRVDATGASNRITAVTYGWRDFLGR